MTVNSNVKCKRSSDGKFSLKGNRFEEKDGILYCYNYCKELLFYTDSKIEEIKSLNWCRYSNGYCSTHINGKQIPLHRFLKHPKNNMVIDHINGDKKDNRLCNLRECTKSENAFNAKLYNINSSGHKGVWFRKDTNKWVAEIKVNYKKKVLGSFKSIEDAIKARKKAEEVYAKEFMRV